MGGVGLADGIVGVKAVVVARWTAVLFFKTGGKETNFTADHDHGALCRFDYPQRITTTVQATAKGNASHSDKFVSPSQARWM